MYKGLHVKYWLFLSDFSLNLNYDRLSKNPQISNFMKIHPLGAELLHADGQTDIQTHDEANIHFSQSCKRTQKNHLLENLNCSWLKTENPNLDKFPTLQKFIESRNSEMWKTVLRHRYQYKNIRVKLHRTKSAIWMNKMCGKLQF